jgi:ADP-heptose:LPS heptosyltransferase
MMVDDPTSILIFRNGSIGNTMAAVPAMRALQRRFPQAAFSVVVDPVGRELLQHCPWISTLIEYDKRGKDRGVRAHLELIRTLRMLAPSHAVLFKRFYRNGLLAFLSGAEVRAGFATDGKAPFLNRTIPYDESVSIVDLNLQLAEWLGAPSAGRHYDVFLSEDDRRQAQQVLAVNGLSDGGFAAAHYGGLTTPPDFIPPAAFAGMIRLAVADRPVVLIGHGAREREWAEALAAENAGFHVAADLPLRTMIALIERSESFFGFNSGPAHLAAGTNTPSIILFRPDDRVDAEIRKWRPPSDLSIPMIPPKANNSAAWNGFLQTVRETVEELLTRQTRNHA